MSAIAIIVLAIVALYLGRTETGSTPSLYSWIAVAAGLAIAGVRAYLRHLPCQMRFSIELGIRPFIALLQGSMTR